MPPGPYTMPPGQHGQWQRPTTIHPEMLHGFNTTPRMMQGAPQTGENEPTQQHIFRDPESGLITSGGPLLTNLELTENEFTQEMNPDLSRKDFNREISDAFKAAFKGHNPYNGDEEAFEHYKNKVNRAVTTLGAPALLQRYGLYEYEVPKPKPRETYAMPRYA